KGDNEFFARATIQYGNPFEDFDKPFSNFTLIGEVGASDSAFINNVHVSGSLYGRAVKDDGKVKRIMTVTANYDYIHNTAIEYGAQSFTLKWLTDYNSGANTHVYTELGAIGVVLAAVPDDYLYYGEGRNYDYGPGGGLLIGGKLVAGRFWYSLNYKGIW